MQDEPDHAGHDEVLALQLGIEAQLVPEFDRGDLVKALLGRDRPAIAYPEVRREEGVLLHGGTAEFAEHSRCGEGVGAVDDHAHADRAPGIRVPRESFRQYDVGGDPVRPQVLLGTRDFRLGRVLDDLGLEGERTRDRLDVLVGDPTAVAVEDPGADRRDLGVADRVAEENRQDRRREQEEDEGAPVPPEVEEFLEGEVVDVAHQVAVACPRA